MPGRQAWGDDDDDDYLPPRQESAVDSKGVKSIVEYHFNDKGQKVRQLGMCLSLEYSRQRPRLCLFRCCCGEISMWRNIRQ